MKNTVKIIRVIAKEKFKELKNKWDIFCNWISSNIKITNLFFRHISGNAKQRSITEIINRLASIYILYKILNKWYLEETRTNVLIEKKNYMKSYRICLIISNIRFYLIIAKNHKEENILISIFANTKKNSVRV